jgi:hypothetical protein
MLLPNKCKDIETLCLWVIEKATKLEPRVINELKRHKWWLLRDYSKGRDTPEVYCMFVEIGLDSPPIIVNNTAILCWSPRPYEWSFAERLIRKFKRKDYPRRGDVLSVISGGNTWFEVKQEYARAMPASSLRILWNSMMNQGWSLVAQGEVAASNYSPMEAA